MIPEPEPESGAGREPGSASPARRERYAELLALSKNEVVTHSLCRYLQLESGRRLALVTLDNGRDYRRPNTLGPHGLVEYAELLDRLRMKAASSEIDAVAVTGNSYIFAAGADLGEAGRIKNREQALKLGELGHEALSLLGRVGVPSFAFVNGLALGGGLEIALHADHRTVNAAATAIGLPETYLGLVPGWGGVTLLPRLVGIRNALKVIIENPLRRNRMLSADDVLNLGIAEALIPSVNFLEDSLRFADRILAEKTSTARTKGANGFTRVFGWPVAVRVARSRVAAAVGTVPQAPYAALDLMGRAGVSGIVRGFERESQTLAELVSGDQFRRSMYAFDLVQKRAKKPEGAPDPALALPIRRVGVIGAGYMAAQIATLMLRRLKVPVTVTDLDQERVDAGLLRVRGEIDSARARGRVSDDESSRLNSLLRGTTDPADFANCDFVIEAVFEDLNAKRGAFAAVEPVLRPDALLATNTSSLLVSEIGAQLAHPERLVGFHFFTPVALLPLVEVVQNARTTDTALATAMALAKDLRKNAVITADSTGFVVNRLLSRLLGEVLRALDDGAGVEQINRGVAPLGLPMTPIQLLDLIGVPVASHVLRFHRRAFPDRFYFSDTMLRLEQLSPLIQKDAAGRSGKTAPSVLSAFPGTHTGPSAPVIQQRVEDALAEEAHLIVSGRVVSAAEDLDLCMILGAGFPLHMGGLTPYLDAAGASERVFGSTFHQPLIQGTRD